MVGGFFAFTDPQHLTASRTHVRLSVMPNPDMLSPHRVSQILGVSTRTIVRWADDPDHPLTVAGRTPGGQRRFRRSDVDQLIVEQMAP